MHFLPFAKQNQAQDFKSCWSFCFELKLLSGSKYSMPWALCAFGNVYIWDMNWHWRWLFHNIFSQILFCIQIVTIFLTYLFPSDIHKSTYVSNNGYTQICPGIGEKMLIWCIVFFPSIQTQLHKIDKKNDKSIQVHVCMKNTFLSLVI